MELGVTAAKIYYGEVGNNLLPFALSLSLQDFARSSLSFLIVLDRI